MRYQIGSQIVDAGTPELQELLVEAHKRHIRPLCLCTAPYPEMYIAHVEGSYLVKRMPNSGARHSADCRSWEPPPEISGRSEVVGHAIRSDPEDAAATLLRLDFPLKVAGRKAPPPAEGGEATSLVANPARLSLRGLLHFLWDDAGLNRWHPGMAGRRSWGTVRHRLLAAAAQAHTANTELGSILLVPEMFHLERKEDLLHRTRAFLRGLAPVGKTLPLGLLVAELKGIAPGTLNRRMLFKHLPFMPLMADEKTIERFERVNEATLALVDTTPGAHAVCIATFSRHPSGFSELREIATMAVTRNWVPFEHEREAILLDALDGGQRAFQKMLRFNLVSTAPIASALLTDTRPDPVALFCPPEQIDEAGAASLQEAAEGGAYPGWLWGAGEAVMPPLPPRWVVAEAEMEVPGDSQHAGAPSCPPALPKAGDAR